MVGLHFDLCHRGQSHICFLLPSLPSLTTYPHGHPVHILVDRQAFDRSLPATSDSTPPDSGGRRRTRSSLGCVPHFASPTCAFFRFFPSFRPSRFFQFSAASPHQRLDPHTFTQTHTHTHIHTLSLPPYYLPANPGKGHVDGFPRPWRHRERGTS